MDRNEVLFWYLLSLGGTWTAILISLIPSQEYASAYGQQVLVFSSCGAIIVGAVGGLVYALWPPRPSSSIQEVRPPETVPVALNAEKLRALSPIHMMIMAIERVSPKEASFGPYAGDGIGRFVPFDTPNLNLDKVRSTFSEHADVLGDHHLKEWLKFDEQISKSVRRGFWVGKSERKWLNELEREYQEAANANLPQAAPEILVKIAPPFVCEPRKLAYLLREEVPPRQVYRCQCLTVKATTTTVKSLMAKTWIDDRGPYFLDWAPKASEPTSENPKRVDLFREEEVQLPIWYAAKQLFGPEEGYPIQLTVVSDDVFKSAQLERLEKPTMDIVIQLIAENYTDPKPRQFELTAKVKAKSWDELNLTEKLEEELTIAPTDLKEHEEIKEIELILRDGRVIRHEARLCYITVTNTGRRSLRVSARLNFDQHMIFVPLNKKPMFRVESKYDTEGFKRQVETFGDEEAIAIALMNDDRWVSRHDVTIHPGPAGETFVLFFTLKGFRVMTVPGGTRIYPNFDVGFPCKMPLGVCLVGDDLSPYCDVATFEVAAKNWKDFEVKQIGKTVRQPVP